MIEFLISIPGPVFLLIYIVVATVTILSCRYFLANDQTKYMEIPEPTKLDPLEVALLRGGVKSAITTSIFHLWQKGSVDISENKRIVTVRQKGKSINKDELNKLEFAIFEYIKAPRALSAFFTSQSKKTIMKVLKPHFDHLKELNLMASSLIRQRNTGVFWLHLLLMLAIGSSKLILGIHRHKPVAFLVLLMIFSTVILVMVYFSSGRERTNLGERFLKRSKSRFDWLTKVQVPDTLLKDRNLIYGIALFGVASFMTPTFASMFESPYLIERKLSSTGSSSMSGCSGGCGGSWNSGCSSGCSSGCGGGCGGCGG